MSNVIQMIPSDAGEVCHLFEVMKKHNVTCSLEFKRFDSADPMIGIAGAAVSVEYFEGDIDASGDSVIVQLGETELTFDLKSHDFSKYVTDCQIEVCIMSDTYAAFFNSGVIPEAGIEEAKNYSELVYTGEPVEIVLDQYEAALIEYIQTLCFEDLLDAHEGIMEAAEKAENMATRALRKGELANAQGFTDRAATLKRLAELMGNANLDYRNHTQG
jgi:hypothetical protein